MSIGHSKVRGAPKSLSAEKLGNLYQPGGGLDLSPTIWKVFQTLNLSGSQVPTLKKTKKCTFPEKIKCSEWPKMQNRRHFFYFGVPTRGEGGSTRLVQITNFFRR